MTVRIETKIKTGLLINKIWFGLLMLYIIASYMAQDVLLPSKINSVMLYVFLAYSALAIGLSKKLKLSSIVLWELICLWLALVAVLYSPSISVFDDTYYSLIVNFIFVFVLSQMDWNKKRLNLIFTTFVLSAVLLMTALALTGNLTDESGRLGTDLVGNANTLAIMLMVSAIYSAWLMVSCDKLRQKLFFLGSLVVIYIGMFLSGGRKFVIVPIIFLYLTLLYKIDRKGKRHIVFNTLIIVGIFFVIYQLIMNVPFFYESIGTRFKGAFGLLTGQHSVDASTALRVQMIEAAFSKWLESPIWGHGFDSFKYYNASYVTGNMYYSHNNFVELLYNQGIIGFIGYYGFYVYLTFNCLKRKHDFLYKGFVIGMIVSWLVFEYFGVTYNIAPTQFALFFAFITLKLRDSSRTNFENKAV